ncbi:hypothetical protein [Rickettsiales endosymbiont of Trichoplax sp. H2]|uniref:hypothetical protein n=1 Tax=Rickettsiales endosymbiont of Trichoplax sp. H2 TaxID=2021221 RepID=UPI0012B371EE|nr:hypothetical protein [Rickettsiales endosymbiont of Trichoplax sp. H2]MSO14428.1 hypothetical protein [Rickettsiales endosymbiont of Trichoplax sp. H2]
MQIYEKVRRSVLVEGLSKREAAKLYRINRKTVAKKCKYATPPKYKRKKGKLYPKIG